MLRQGRPLPLCSWGDACGPDQTSYDQRSRTECASASSTKQGVTRVATTSSLLDELFYIAENRKAPRAETCSVLFGSICGPLTSEVHNWTIHISVPSKSRAHEDSQHNSMEDNSEEDNVEKGVKVLHISDTHYDPEYSPGSNAVCDDPVCCRKNNGLPKSAADRAGRWGHLGKCDIPLRTLESALKHASENHKV
ncbi:hypothetical protein MTO96_026222 [Rhipicephalus appendiculatus]